MVRSDFHCVHGILQKLKWILFFITGMRQKPTSKSVNWTILKPTDRKFNFYYLLLINNSIYCGLYKNLIYFKLIHARIIHIWNANANNSHWEPTYAATIGKNAGNINEMNFGSYWSELNEQRLLAPGHGSPFDMHCNHQISQQGVRYFQ